LTQSLEFRRAIFAAAFIAEGNKFQGRTKEDCIREGLHQVRSLQSVDLTKLTLDEQGELAELVTP
jgi:hypothetical protein